MAVRRKQFFFKKKNQKTFDSLASGAARSRHQINKSFLLLFFKKEVLSFSSSMGL
jgi:hypothetical protein